MKEFVYPTGTGLLEILPSGSAICIATNCCVNSKGKAIMGKGIARYINESFKGIDIKLGSLISTDQTGVFSLGEYSYNGKIFYLYNFPTKYNWMDNSSYDLIIESAKKLYDLTKDKNNINFYIPAPGCGYGNLDYKRVKAILSDLLIADNYIIVK